MAEITKQHPSAHYGNNLPASCNMRAHDKLIRYVRAHECSSKKRKIARFCTYFAKYVSFYTYFVSFSRLYSIKKE